MKKIELRTHGPMSYFPLRSRIEYEIRESGITEGLVTIHARGATPAIVIVSQGDLEHFDELLKKLVPVAGWRHGNAYAHLRSTIISTTKTLVFIDDKILLPPDYEVYFLETRPVYNHRRIVHIYIRGTRTMSGADNMRSM